MHSASADTINSVKVVPFRPPPPTTKPPTCNGRSDATHDRSEVTAKHNGNTSNTAANKVSTKKAPKEKVNFNSLVTVSSVSDIQSGDSIAFKYLKLCARTFCPVLSEFIRGDVVKIVLCGGDQQSASLEVVITKTDPSDEESYVLGEQASVLWRDVSDVKVVVSSGRGGRGGGGEVSLEKVDQQLTSSVTGNAQEVQPPVTQTVVEVSAECGGGEDSIEGSGSAFSLFDLFAEELEQKKMSLEGIICR
eukprot:gene24523-30878_t